MTHLQSLPLDAIPARHWLAKLDLRLERRGAKSILSHVRHQGPLRHAFEVRHPSFLDAGFADLLRARNMALVVADSAGVESEVPMTVPVIALCDQSGTANARLRSAGILTEGVYPRAPPTDSLWARAIRVAPRGSARRRWWSSPESSAPHFRASS